MDASDKAPESRTESDATVWSQACILARRYQEKHFEHPNTLIMSPGRWAAECERHSPLLSVVCDTWTDTYRRAVHFYHTDDAQLRVLLDPSLDDDDISVARMA